MMGICYRYVNSKEEAREMLNIGFTKMLYNLEKYKPEVPFKAWMRKVMINILIDEYRKEKKHHEKIHYVDEYNETQEYAEVNDALVKMNVDQIHALIVKLPPMSQKVFNLFVIDGYSHKEIAGMLHMSEGTSKWHLNFSRGKLKEMITNLISPVKEVL
jgi:RNA polymerase sigma factor (sigma-70 family)